MSEMHDAYVKRGELLAAAFNSVVEHALGEDAVSLAMPKWTTGKGLCAQQHIRIVTKGGESLIIGYVNALRGVAELSTMGNALALSVKNLGHEIALDRAAYMRFLEEATACLEDFGLEVRMAASTPFSSAPPPPVESGFSLGGALSAAASFFGSLGRAVTP